MNDPALLLVAIVSIGLLCHWFAWWLRLPAILPLLLVGVVLGPVTGWLNPDQLLGELLFPIVSLGVAVILFEGSLTLKRHQLAEDGVVIRNLVSWGALVNGALIALAAMIFTPLSLSLSILFGALMTVTGPTVVMPLLRTVRANRRITNILRWEGILIDPIGALLAVVAFEVIAAGSQSHPVATLLQTVVVGTAGGWLAGVVLAALLRRHLIPAYLINILTLGAVLLLFVVTNLLAHEAGLLAVTVMGIWLANQDDLLLAEVVSFKESLALLIVAVLFILLAARLEPTALSTLGIGTLWLLLAIVVIARPAAVALTTLGSHLDWRERATIAFIAPRGIVAAAVSALFALRLESLGVAGAELLAPLSFLVIIATVLLQSIAARPFASALAVTEPEPNGILIIGSNRFARALANSLQQAGVRVLLVGDRWDEVGEARMSGIPTYFGHPLSEHADRHLDLVGIGTLLAISRRASLNSLTTIRFRHEFGHNRVYTLRTGEERSGGSRATHHHLAAARLFSDKETLSDLIRMLGEGGVIRATRLSDDFDFPAYIRRYHHRARLLLAIDRNGTPHPYSPGRDPEAESGWRLVALIPAELANSLQDQG